MSHLKSICVYCGSSPGNHPGFTTQAYRLGETIAQANLRLVYGGGTKGLMGAVAQGVLDRGGEAMGIIPEFLMEKEATKDALGSLTELVVTKNMHERKHRMFDEADAFVTLPGGIGTLEEVVEVLTWAQLGRHDKPIVLANFNGFWNPLTDLIDHMRRTEFVHTGHRVKPLVINDVEDIVSRIATASATVAHEGGNPAVIEKL